MHLLFAHARLNTRVIRCVTCRQRTALFLYNFSARVLYGVYLGHEVGLDLDLDAWQGRFPAQVQSSLLIRFPRPLALFVWLATPFLLVQDPCPSGVRVESSRA
jgi:hypothetical protein